MHKTSFCNSERERESLPCPSSYHASSPCCCVVRALLYVIRTHISSNLTNATHDYLFFLTRKTVPTPCWKTHSRFSLAAHPIFVTTTLPLNPYQQHHHDAPPCQQISYLKSNLFLVKTSSSTRSPRAFRSSRSLSSSSPDSPPNALAILHRCHFEQTSTVS